MRADEDRLRASARPRVLILSFTETIRNPRPLKQIAVLKDRYDVTVASFGPSPDPDVEFIALDPDPPRRGLAKVTGIFTLLFLLRMYRAHESLDARNQDPLRRLRGRSWDLVIAHDPDTLAVAMQLDSRNGVLVDLHEFSPDMNEPSWRWRVLDQPYYRWVCRTHVPRAAAVTTVSPGIVDRYRREFGFESTLVMNATPYFDGSPSDPGTTIRLVHSGIAAPDRRLEVLVDAVVASGADVTLDLFLLEPDADYSALLRRRAGADPRIRFNDPVAYRDLVPTLNRFDVGVHVIAPTSFNNLWALPNKFFDFIQARLGVIIGPSPAMARIAEEEGIGVVLPSFEADDLRAALDSLERGQVDAWKRASDLAAPRLSGEAQASIWADLVDDLIP